MSGSNNNCWKPIRPNALPPPLSISVTGTSWRCGWVIRAWLQPEAGNISADAAALPVLTAADQGVALTALQQRPDVQQAWFELQASNAAVAAAVANRFPRFTLTASYRGEDANLRQCL